MSSETEIDRLVEELCQLQGIKNVKKQRGPVLKINLFTREIPDSEAVEIRGDLRKISQKIRNKLEEYSSKGDILGWEWIIKPEKKYQETKLGKKTVSDRKSKGHKPGYYQVSIREP